MVAITRSGDRPGARLGRCRAALSPLLAETRRGRTGHRRRPRRGSEPQATPRSRRLTRTPRWPRLAGARRPRQRHPAERRAGNRHRGRTACRSRVVVPRSRACNDPVFSHQAPGVSPGAGIMALTSTTALTGTSKATSGAVNPPSDWATSTRSSRPSIASTTLRVYSGRPAPSSSPGRSIAIVPCPARCRCGSTRCQYQAAPPAPGIRANVLTLPSAGSSRNPLAKRVGAGCPSFASQPSPSPYP
jgi:hypothetical protein